VIHRTAVVLLGLVVLTGCSSSDVPLTSRPTDLDGARALARAVADAGSCGGFEDFSASTDRWDFTCQDGGHSFTIRTVADPQARRRGLADLEASGAPVKGAGYFLVQEDPDYGPDKTGTPRARPVSDLDRFPGRILSTAGSTG
jgi:hypothetical protein